jgi:diguanylate cyclase (GGDEF)-like protein
VLLCLDLDDFKAVNDRQGHETGDAGLRAVADRLRQACRSSDVISRLAGDEFVVLCAGLNETEGDRVASRLVEAVGHAVQTQRGEVTVTASCGVIPVEEGRTAKQLLDAADAAMYRAKKAGRNRTSR